MPLDNFDSAYSADISNRAALLRREEEEEIARLRKARAEVTARENEAAAQGETPDVEVDDDLGEENDPAAEQEEETSMMGDMAAGFVNGLRDAGVNTMQLGLDVVTFGQSGVDLDEMVPDVEDRDSTTFALTSGLTQFASAFIPVLGVMGRMGKATQIAKKLSKAREFKVGRAFTGVIAKDALAGAVADVAVFSPYEARFSDLIQDTEFANPVTEFLASDADDSALEGRLKNVLEGAGLGLTFDAIFRGIVRSKEIRKSFQKMLARDVDPAIAHEVKQVYENVGFARTQAEEARITLEAAQAGAEPLDEAAQAALAAARAADPEAAGKVGTASTTAVETLARHADETAAALREAERDLLDASLDPRLADAIDDDVAGELDRIAADVDERIAADVDAARAEHPRAEEATTANAGRSIADVADPDAPRPQTMTDQTDIHVVDDAGNVFLDEAGLAAHKARRATEEATADAAAATKGGAKGTVKQFKQYIDMNDPVYYRAVTAIFRAAGKDVNLLDVDSLARLSNLNPARIAGDVEAKELSLELAEFVKANMNIGTHRPIKQTVAKARQIVQREAELLGTPEAADALLTQYERVFAENLEHLDVHIMSLRMLTKSAEVNARQAGVQVLNMGGMGSLGQYIEAVHAFTRLESLRDASVAAVARTLGSQRGVAHAQPVLVQRSIGGELTKEQLAHYQVLVDAAGGEKAVRFQAQQLVPVLSDPAARMAVIRASVTRTGQFGKMGLEYWLNSILSSPITQVVNVASNTAVMMWTPLEELVHGLTRRAFGSDDFGLVDGALKQYQGMYAGFRAAVKLSGTGAQKDVFTGLIDQLNPFSSVGALERSRHSMAGRDDIGSMWKALVGDDPHLIPDAKQFDINFTNAVTGDNAAFVTGIKALEGDSFGGRLVESFGNWIRLPGRFLTTGDEFAKTMNYHMKLNQLSFDMARSGPREMMDANVIKYVREAGQWRTLPHLDDLTRETYEQMDTIAKDHARKNTFTTPLKQGSLGKGVQNLVVKQPWLRLFVPFIRTPSNLLEFTFERSPFAIPFKKGYGDAFRALWDKTLPDTPEMAAKRARMTIGTGLYATAGMLTYNGILTGAGPSQPEERSALLATGWQPYSVRMKDAQGNDTYYSYNRSDPFGLFLGLASTWSENTGSMLDGEVFEGAGAMLIALSETLQSKAYFTGLTSLVSALDQPERYGPALVQQFAGSLVPNFVGTTNRTGIFPTDKTIIGTEKDTVMRSADNWLQAIVAKLPGGSTTLPPRRNVFGEVIHYAPGFGPDTISPFATRTSPNTKVNREIQRLVQEHGFGMTMSGFKRIKNIELTPRQQDRYIVLASGDPSRNGTDLRKALANLMRTAAYKRADSGPDGKQALIKTLIRKRKARAARLLLREDHELFQSTKDKARERRSALREEASTAQNDSRLLDDGINSILGFNA